MRASVTSGCHFEASLVLLTVVHSSQRNASIKKKQKKNKKIKGGEEDEGKTD